jgi:hypothetical protein
MGLEQTPNWVNSHRVLNRAKWSTWLVSRLLVQQIVSRLLPGDGPITFLIDETLERRKGPQIRYLGCFRDAVRSSATYLNHALGIRWIVIAVLVKVPWDQRPWALPFLSFPALSPATSLKLNKRHRTSIEWSAYLIRRIRRWLPERELIVVGDGAYAVQALFRTCQSLTPAVHFVSRLRFDAALYQPPAPRLPGKRGRPAKKGPRDPHFATRLSDPTTIWHRLSLRWYGGQTKAIEYATNTALWYTPGSDPLKLRWVLLRCPNGSFRPTVLCSSTPELDPQTLICAFIGRWNLEVTFQEVRAHLGVETQRQWSDRAIERSTPCLFGLFSLVVLMALVLHPEQLPLPTSAWYHKSHATFSDALAAVRRHLWGVEHFQPSPAHHDSYLIPPSLWRSLLFLASYAN